MFLLYMYILVIYLIKNLVVIVKSQTDSFFHSNGIFPGYLSTVSAYLSTFQCPIRWGGRDGVRTGSHHFKCRCSTNTKIITIQTDIFTNFSQLLSGPSATGNFQRVLNSWTSLAVWFYETQILSGIPNLVDFNILN